MKLIKTTEMVLALAIVTVIAMSLASCENDTNNISTQSRDTIANQNAKEDSVFTAKKSEFRAEIDNRIEELKDGMEQTTAKIEEATVSLNEKMRKQYVDLRQEMSVESEKLRAQVKKIDDQTEENWEVFKMDTRDNWQNTKIEYQELELKLKKSFDSLRNK